MAQRVLVIGAGKSGAASGEFLARHGEQVIITAEKREEKVEWLRELGVEFIWEQQPDLAEVKPDYLVVSPGVPLSIPPLVQAQEMGIPVLGELELAYRYAHAPFLAITGTNGKTTTTTLVGELMKTVKEDVFVGGNIGIPLISAVEDLSAESVIVAEVSSFQLETTTSFCPHIALMLNLTPDHLDRHGDMAGYLAAKARIFAAQGAEDYLVLNYDDTALRNLAPNAKAKVIFFSQKNKLEEGVYLENGMICLTYNGETLEICAAEELKIKGAHNLENAMGATAVAFAAGVPREKIAAVLRSFAGVEHRMEPVRTVRGVQYVNDSKGTNPDATMKALVAYQQPIIVILGGKNKGSDFTELAGVVKQQTKAAVLLGQAKEELKEALDKVGFTAYTVVQTFEEAVATAAAQAQEGDLVLLSPACASWDMFKSFEERGDLFKSLVQNL